MSVSISKSLSSKIKGTTFLCTVLIVLLHAYEESLLSESNHCSFYVAQFLSMGICGAAVPFFFMVSGFLLACQYDGGVPYSQLVKKRLISLGKPYVYWCILYAFAYLLFAILGNYLAGRMLTENTCLAMPHPWMEIFRIFGLDLAGFPADGPLWYVRNLFLLVLLSPILMTAMKKKTIGQIVIVFIFVLYLFHFTISQPWWQIFDTGFSFRGLLAFLIGIYLERFSISWRPKFTISLLLCLIWIVLALPWKLSSNWEFIALHVSFVIGCIALWSIYDYIPWREKLESCHCIRYSFFIFASHFAILNILFCLKGCNFLRKHIMDSDWLIYFLRFLVPLSISFGVAFILERYCPKLYRALTGGR